VEVIREMECLELAFDRERSFLKNISRYDNRRVRGDDFCREGRSRLNHILPEGGRFTLFRGVASGVILSSGW
jgi:hypothetical protein